MHTVLFVLGLGLILLVVERLIPGRLFPKRAYWYTRAIGFNLVQAGSVFLAAVTWDPILAQYKLLDLENLGTVYGALVGYVGITFVFYWWHRARHESSILWTYLHQVHHSPARLEVLTSFYKHPLEIILNSILSSFLLITLFGLSPEAISVAFLMTGVAELFYHWNIKTPYWLGFLIQRPESHCVHHQKGYHKNNYSDLPLWDMIFGTFENPRNQVNDCGFSSDKELDLMGLIFPGLRRTAKGVINENSSNN
jgi:sterol desaturase/sphingolipid hydroxylase (fatty acid hydroxylase superfamily)